MTVKGLLLLLPLPPNKALELMDNKPFSVHHDSKRISIPQLSTPFVTQGAVTAYGSCYAYEMQTLLKTELLLGIHGAAIKGKKE